MSKIKPESHGIFSVDGNQGEGVLHYTFERRGKIPAEVLQRPVELRLRTGDRKADGTKGTVRISYGGRMEGSRRGLKRGRTQIVTLPAAFFGEDKSIELEVTVLGRDGVGLHSADSGLPPRLLIRTDPKNPTEEAKAEDAPESPE